MIQIAANVGKSPAAVLSQTGAGTPSEGDT